MIGFTGCKSCRIYVRQYDADRFISLDDWNTSRLVDIEYVKILLSFFLSASTNDDSPLTPDFRVTSQIENEAEWRKRDTRRRRIAIDVLVLTSSSCCRTDRSGRRSQRVNAQLFVRPPKSEQIRRTISVSTNSVLCNPHVQYFVYQFIELVDDEFIEKRTALCVYCNSTVVTQNLSKA